jgi:hypothetical protein
MSHLRIGILAGDCKSRQRDAKMGIFGRETNYFLQPNIGNGFRLLRLLWFWAFRPEHCVDGLPRGICPGGGRNRAATVHGIFIERFLNSGTAKSGTLVA